jgi:hypothetical protein
LQVLHNHGVEDNPGFGLVVHPPVGKQLIVLGEAIFGYNGVGWRFTGALLGVVMVALVVRIVRRISGYLLQVVLSAHASTPGQARQEICRRHACLSECSANFGPALTFVPNFLPAFPGN